MRSAASGTEDRGRSDQDAQDHQEHQWQIPNPGALDGHDDHDDDQEITTILLYHHQDCVS